MGRRALSPERKKLKELEQLFEDLPDNKLKLLRGHMEKAAYLYGMMVELEEFINEHGTAFEYINARGQTDRKEYPEHKNYQTCVKNYNMVMSTLVKELPVASKGKSELEKFAARKRVK